MTAGFRCKQFFVAQQQGAMKVSTDALLLGAWCPAPAQGDVLDIGTGTGILALMLAQRTLPAQSIDAVELDSAAALQAAANVRHSPWPTRIRVIERDILTYPGSPDHQSARRYRLIISNPPYFTAALVSQRPDKAAARHNSGLPFADLLMVAAKLATTDGQLALVLPVQESLRLQALAPAAGWFLQQQQPVVAVPGKTPWLDLLLFSRQAADAAALADGRAPAPLPALLVRQTDGQYSLAYKTLLQDFYLKF